MPNLSKARELREKRAKLVADARAIYDNSARTKEDNEKFDAMMAEADGVKVEIDREERLDAAERETRGNGGAPPAGRVGDVADNDVEAHVSEYRTAHRRHDTACDRDSAIARRSRAAAHRGVTRRDARAGSTAGTD